MQLPVFIVHSDFYFFVICFVVQLQSAPIIRYFLPFLAGVLYAVHVQVAHPFWSLAVFISLFLMLAAYTFGLSKSFRFAWLFGLFTNTTFFSLAVFLVNWNTPLHNADHYSKLSRGSVDVIVAEIDSPPIEKAKTIQIKLNVRCLSDGVKLNEASGSILAYVKKTEFDGGLKYGDVIAFRNEAKPILGPKNPDQFDFRHYMSMQGIYESIYLDQKNSVVLDRDQGFFLYHWADELRLKFLKVLTQNGIKEDQFAVASALLIGQRNYLDAETIEDYSNAGAMHVLAVSGLHVGILYLILNFLLNFFGKSRRARGFTCVVLLSALWLYAMITGFSPSVLRATIMFSFVILANAINRNGNIYNTIAASAFLLLIVDPYLLFHVGFQLSYLAVLGIIYFQPKIYGLISVKYKLLDYVWKITAVSIAAQLTTFPICIYYFHQFPAYFLLSNLIVIPFAGIIFVLGVALLLSAFSSLISGWVGALLDQVISILNLCVKFINELPFSVADGLHISPLECLLLYGCLIFGIMAIEMKKLRILYAAAVGLLAFILLDLYEDFKLSKSRSICFYSAGWNNLALDCISNNEHVFVCNGPLCQNTKQLDFHVRNYWDALDLKKETVVEQQENISIDANSFSKVDGFIQFRDKLIYLQYDQGEIPEIEFDVLYVNDFWNYYNHRDRIHAKHVVFGSNISSKFSAKLEGQGYHFLHENAFVLDVP